MEDSKAIVRSGYVAIIGKPNAGKSTFLNAVLGEKISIVTEKPQTTRNRIIGIKTEQDYQIVFVDTPGIHRPKHALGAHMVREAKKAIKEVDAIVFMVDPEEPGAEDHAIIKLLQGVGKPVLLVINKIDTVKKQYLLPVCDAYGKLYEFADIIPISALKGEGVDIVIAKASAMLPEGPQLYPEDIATDMLERFIAAEFIREKVMRATNEEVPHSVAVEVMQWEERKSGVLFISANIYVEKDGQKGIIIGNKGAKLKEIGTLARADIEGLLGVKVFLELFVKVRESWRTNRNALSELGYN